MSTLALLFALAACGPAPPGVGAADAGPPLGAGPGIFFEDVTARAGVSLERAPAEGLEALYDRVSGGVCALDVDGEGPLDLFFALRPAGGSRLLVGRTALEYRDETEPRGLADVGDAVGCLAFDAEGDGDDDLLVTGVGTLRLMLRDGSRFADASERLGVDVDAGDGYASAAAGDLDGDGDLDLVVAGFMRTSPRETDPEACAVVGCRADVNAHRPVPSLLLLRDGDRYVDATASAPDLARAEPTLAVTVVDVDGDGAPEIFVGNDLGARHPDRVLARTPEGGFEDVAGRLGLRVSRAGRGTCTMGLAHGDLDGDARLDHVVTSFEADPTAVLICPAGAPCEDRSASAGTHALADTFRWAPALLDVDLDGRLDLLEATGHLATDREIAEHAIGRMPFAQPENLYLGRGDGTLAPVAPVPPDALADPHPSRGLAVVDLDDDGRLDVVLATVEGPMVLLRNVATPAGRHLRVGLRGRPPNTGAVGARVTVERGGQAWVRARLAGEGYLGSSDPRLHFGLGPAPEPVRVTVTWPDGERTVVDDVAPGTELTVSQP